MKKIVTIIFVLFMAYIGLGLSVAQGNDNFKKDLENNKIKEI